jgi:hypothetical protein
VHVGACWIGKLTEPTHVSFLSLPRYGNRLSHNRGIADIVLAPPLTIAQEWERDHHWEDGTTVPRSSSDEWDYVWKQAAVEGRGGVPGFDEGHAGMKIADFRQLFVKLVATVGGSTKLIPTMQEVAACRIYTGPAHAKINSFMRMVSDGDAGRSWF